MLNDEYFLQKAYEYAMTISTDPSTQNGACLVAADGEILVYGANHFPAGVKETPSRWERPIKYKFVEHAERNCIYAAAREGIRTKGLIMYCPWFACADCARAIVQSGIKMVIGHDSVLQEQSEHWKTQWKESIEVGDTILHEGGVSFKRIKADIKDVKIRFNGELKSP